MLFTEGKEQYIVDKISDTFSDDINNEEITPCDIIAAATGLLGFISSEDEKKYEKIVTNSVDEKVINAMTEAIFACVQLNTIVKEGKTLVDIEATATTLLMACVDTLKTLEMLKDYKEEGQSE